MPLDLSLFLPLSYVNALLVCTTLMSLYDTGEPQNRTRLAAEYRFTVAPNPVVTWLSVTIFTPEPMPLYLTLADLTGRRYSLPVIPANTASTQIDMTVYPVGI